MLNFIQDVIYQIKRDYGQPVDVYSIISDEVDIQTGVRIVHKTRYDAIAVKMFPSLQRMFKKDLTHDANIEDFLITDLEPILKIEDFIVVNQKLFEIVSIMEEVEINSYFVKLKETGGKPNQILDLTSESQMDFEQQV